MALRSRAFGKSVLALRRMLTWTWSRSHTSMNNMILPHNFQKDRPMGRGKEQWMHLGNLISIPSPNIHCWYYFSLQPIQATIHVTHSPSYTLQIILLVVSKQHWEIACFQNCTFKYCTDQSNSWDFRNFFLLNF